jgi:centromeric protein E
MAEEERILVSVRLRPVNAREAERGDGSDWECAGPTTLMFRGNIPERAMFPATYTYGEHSASCMHVLEFFSPSCQSNCSCFSPSSSDRVFNPECNTRQVYEEGAKQVALSGLSGINCMYARIQVAAPIFFSRH